MNPEVFRQRLPVVQDILGPDAVESAFAGSVDDRRRIVVMLTLFDLLLGPDEQTYGDMLDVLMDWLCKQGPDWADHADYDYLAELCEAFIRAGRPLPPPLDDFAVGVLHGVVRRTNRGPHRNKLAFRNEVILEAIVSALSVGDIRATRNESETSDAQSACDVVSECLRSMGYKVPYRTVAGIYEDFKKGMKSA